MEKGNTTNSSRHDHRTTTTRRLKGGRRAAVHQFPQASSVVSASSLTTMAAAMATAQLCGVQRAAQLQTPSVRKAMLAAPRRQRRAAAMIKPVASAQLALARTSKDDVETK